MVWRILGHRKKTEELKKRIIELEQANKDRINHMISELTFARRVVDAVRQGDKNRIRRTLGEYDRWRGE